MIDGVGNNGVARVDVARVAVERGTPAPRTGDAASQDRAAAAGGAIAALVGKGSPVDSDKVAAIKAAIAEGRYPVDADRIAERMMALDLPGVR